MANVYCRKDTGMLLLDFRWQGQRCREHTLLPDTPVNRARLESLAKRIERTIQQGTFQYSDFFPNSSRARQLDVSGQNSGLQAASNGHRQTPLFKEFVEVWYSESLPRWRKRHRKTMRQTIDRIFVPNFGAKPLAEISRPDLLAFRAQIANRPGRGGQTISAKRINKLMMELKAILNDGCERYDIPSPARGIKPLKQKRSEIYPFSLAEVDQLVANVRDDYRTYITMRCLTGLRTGEANGLQWGDIDFERNVIRVERAVSRDGDDELKTDLSKREVPMVPRVRAALEEHKAQSTADCQWVFHSPAGNPIDEVNFTNRVWYPLLRYLGLAQRRPYHMRHTAATLMLASGENPEWVAKVLGHSTAEMLFRVYSRFIPNLTRLDGRAFTGLINSHSAEPKPVARTPQEVDSMDTESLRRELKAALLARNRGVNGDNATRH